MNKRSFFGKVGLQQRVFPKYRSIFFEYLASACSGGFSLIAGDPRKSETIITANDLPSGTFVHARNLHLFSGGLYICLQAGLMKWLVSWDPEVVILEANPRYLTNRSVINWMHARGRPVVGWGLGVPERTGLMSRMGYRSRDRYLRSFDAMIAYSSVGAAQYVSSGMSEEQVFVAVNSVTPPPESFYMRGSVENRSPRILFVGRLQKRKRVDHLLHACAALEQRPELWIVGDGPERLNLETAAKRIFPSAQFKGAKEGAELEACYQYADLFVLPGTGGLAVQEAMSYGLPVIVAAGDGTQHDLVTEENGWLVKPGDQEDLIQAIQEALSNPARLLKQGEASFNIIRQKANIQVMSDVFVRTLECVRDKGR